MSCRLRRICLSAVLAAALAGCGGRTPVYPVSGKVLVKGQPADAAFLVFEPVGARPESHRPFATAESDGSFKLTTFDVGDGASAGEYKVSVVWRPKAKTALASDGPDRLHGKYESAEKSGLKAKVEAKPNALAPFELTP